MTICSLQFQTSYFQSAESGFKILEILLCGACWGVIFIGNVLSKSYVNPEIYSEVLVFILCTLPPWIITCLTYIMFLFTTAKKQAHIFDLVMNFCFCIGAAFAVGFAGTKTGFLWLCPTEDGSYIHPHLCPPSVALQMRNSGENFAVLIFGALTAAIYFTHMIYTAAKLCTNNNLTVADTRGIFQPVA